ncbi:AraC-type DNA-binding protein [Filimonas lacunae]|uniref:AraC-type DNA-binding protein n=1 Tax=Filimonas lacunae TaxID=477680 RepID=A0A173MHI6_9BACT|nr:helix-turn-helix domain-containing protein [Filimonas lacunae]BAV07084.1 transcriptional regulator, AraC family [Filimonas lacunae]SIS95213.1 AraC-type DNA-binding protein [Filimonas lacunae]
MKKQAIAIHRDELKNTGVDVAPLGEQSECVQLPHRDDHYMFMIQQKGSCVWELDFNEVKLSGTSLGYVAPGQVHRYVRHTNSVGWLVFVTPERISAQYREILSTYQHIQQVVAVPKNHAAFTITPLLIDARNEDATLLRKTICHSLVDVLAGLVASGIAQAHQAVGLIGSQKYHTVLRFKQLVIAHYKEKKLVKDYSALLNLTPLYLNEVVKEITGFPASYWIQESILLEAKRLLHYTTLDVKQVAYELGYDDHAYFSRFFKKHTGMTATAFRNR